MLTVKVKEIPDVDGLMIEIRDLQERIEATEREVDDLKGEAESLGASVADLLEGADAEGDLGDTIRHYQVKSLAAFFSVYEFSPEDQETIREQFEDGDLLVYQDAGVLWSDGRILIEPSEEFISDDDFEFEAGWVGGGVL